MPPLSWMPGASAPFAPTSARHWYLPVWFRFHQNRRYLNFPGVRNPLLGGGGVTFDLWCPFSNLDELFQSKVMCENLVWIGWNCKYVNFQGSRTPLLGGLHVTCNAHFRTCLRYSSQKSCVKIWFWLVEPFKSYRGNRQKKKKKKFSGGRHPLLGRVVSDLWCPFSNSDELFQSNVMCQNLVWIGWNRRYVKFRGGRNPLLRGHMWPAIAILVHGRTISIKSLVWKFGSDWLSLSRVIVVTDKKKK